MSGGSSGGQSTTINQLDPDLKNAWLDTYGKAKDVAAQPFQAYTGQLTAGDNEYLQAARGQAAQAAQIGAAPIGVAQETFSQIARQSPTFFDAPQAGAAGSVNAATAATTNATASALDPAAYQQQVTAGSIPGGDLSGYMNPYQSAVIDQSNAEIERQRQMVQNQNAAAATAAGAFGGSRHGIVDAENNRNFAQLQQQNTNNLLGAGFDRATGLMSADADRALQADVANQGVMSALFDSDASRRQQTALANASAANANAQFNAGQINAAATGNADRDIAARSADADRISSTNALNSQIDQANTGANLQAASALVDSAGAQQNLALNAGSALQSVGTALQQNQQAGLDAQYGQFQRQIGEPLQDLQTLESAFGILPSTSSGGSTSSNAKSKGYSL